MLWKIFKNIVRTVMEWLLKLFHIEWTKRQWESFMQFIKFGLVGVTNTVLAYAINVLVLLALKNAKLPYDYIIGNLVSFFLSVLWSFYWNDKYVFKMESGEERTIGKALLKTYVSYGFTGIVLNNILSIIWISVLEVSKYIAPVFNLLLSVPINFFLNKFWAFKKEEK